MLGKSLTDHKGLQGYVYATKGLSVNVNVYDSTIKTTLNSYCLHSRAERRKPLLTQNNTAFYLQFANYYKGKKLKLLKYALWMDKKRKGKQHIPAEGFRYTCSLTMHLSTQPVT